MTHVVELAQWAWGTEAGKVLETKFMSHPEDRALQTHLMNRHQQCTTPPLNARTVTASAPAENTAVKQLAESISQRTE